MNDPWDVKSVRQSGQYVSCMKINGIPLLPPVLSRECRKEMQYYKLLAKEVEKRISILKSYVTESETDSSEDKTDAPEIPEYEQSYELPAEDIQAGFNINIDKITAITNEKPDDKSPVPSPKSLKNSHPSSDTYNSITSNILVETIPSKSSPKLVIDLSLSINDTGRSVLESVKKTPPIDLPEHDYPKKLRDKELLTDIETVSNDNGKNIVKDIVNFRFDIEKNTLGKSDPIPDLPLSQDGPSSLSSKSFTGSLIDIHTESVKEAQKMPKLIRQRSYTVLKPSPQLLAHLEVQSLNTGVDMTSISMSDSLSNLSLQNKKRRSWDLESAKVKWSSMALELQKSVPNSTKSTANKNSTVKHIAKKVQSSPPRARSIVQDKVKRSSVTPKTLLKLEPIQKPRKSLSPVRNVSSSRTIVKEPISPIINSSNKESSSLKNTPQLISESEDPATRVKELYERIQKQQLMQMANLVEKQKREQILLQQVFDEQNNLLYKQLKTIRPKTPTEVKEACGEIQSNHGPVSLSQLINHKSPEQSNYDSSISATLTETNNCLNQSENILKKSKDITGSIKKQQSKSQSLNGTKIQSRSPSTKATGANIKSTSRRLNYDTSGSTDRDYEPLLTDRTNDTMADLNVTFPSDHSDECQPFNHTHSNPVTHCGDLAMVYGCPTGLVSQCVSTDKSMKNIEKCVQKSAIKNACTKLSAFHRPPTTQELAAATKIVAFAKGYLVRRLMRTERVQATVQTIKDALLCALQLHQDREGIRGADVDLHRRLIQQITAACYSLHDTFVASTPAERCALIAADRDRGRRRSLASRPPSSLRHHSQSDVMSKSHTGAFPPRGLRAPSSSLMTQSNYETFSGSKCGRLHRARYMPSPRRRPWR